MLSNEETPLSNPPSDAAPGSQSAPPIPPPVEPIQAPPPTFVAPAEFRSPVSLARRTVIACIVNMVVNGVSIGVSLSQMALLQASLAGNAGADGLLGIADTLSAVIALGAFGVIILLLVFLLMWVYRCYDNLKSLGAEGLAMTPGWAVGSFFIPILNLVRPYEIVREIWKASDPAGIVSATTRNDALAWKKLSAPALIGWWWGAWVFSQLASQAIGRMMLRGDATPSVAEWQTQTVIEIGSEIIDLISLYLTILVVRRITDLQMEKAALVAEANKPALFDSAGAIPANLTGAME